MVRAVKEQDLSGLTPNEAAAYWLVRHDAGELTEAEKRLLETWLAESQANADAYKKAQHGWQLFDQDTKDPHIQALRRSALEAGPEKRDWFIPQVAASIAALCLFGGVLWYADPFSMFESTETASLYEFGIPDYQTAKGERLNLTLPDGTAVTLNTESTLDVAYEDGKRLLRLVKGQAFFEVAKNPNRPFVVQAADRQITALGTSFDVRLEDDKFQVVLVEGKIAVERQASEGAVIEEIPNEEADAEDVSMILTQGQELVVESGVAEKRVSIDEGRGLRWREGFVEFQGEALADAIAELNRYARVPLVVDDDRVANLQISGVFLTSKPENFTEVVDELLPVAIDRRSGREVRLVWAGE